MIRTQFENVQGKDLEGPKRSNAIPTSERAISPWSSPHLSPEREVRERRFPEIQDSRETKRADDLYGTSSPLSERKAVDSGRCAPAAVGW